MEVLKVRGQRKYSEEWNFLNVKEYLTEDGHEINDMIQYLHRNISMFIGITDINKNEIYEGDKIKFFIAPKELEWDSSENMFGTEPQVSWQECTKATRPIKVEAEVYYNTDGLAFSIKNINCEIMQLDDEEYHIADPKEIAGGADGFEYDLQSFYKDFMDFEIDSMLYSLGWQDFINIEVVGNVY